MQDVNSLLNIMSAIVRLHDVDYCSIFSTDGISVSGLSELMMDNSFSKPKHYINMYKKLLNEVFRIIHNNQ